MYQGVCSSTSFLQRRAVGLEAQVAEAGRTWDASSGSGAATAINAALSLDHPSFETFATHLQQRALRS
jgi:hypothetical protein